MLDTFTGAYIECAFWSSRPDGAEGRAWDAADPAPETIRQMEADCRAFCDAHADLIGDDPARAGHDFWLTRCGHGCGFWDGDWPEPAASILTDASDRFGNVDLYESEGLIWH